MTARRGWRASGDPARLYLFSVHFDLRALLCLCLTSPGPSSESMWAVLAVCGQVHIRGACFDTPDEPAGRRWRTTQAGVSRRLIGADRSVTRHTWQPAKISSAAVRPRTHSVLASTDTTRQAEDAGAFDQDLTMWCVSCLRESLIQKEPRVARVRSPRCSAERRVRSRYLVQLTISVHNGVVESHLENIERDPMLLGSPLGSLEYARPYG